MCEFLLNESYNALECMLLSHIGEGNYDGAKNVASTLELLVSKI